MNQYKRNKSIDSLLPIGRGQRELITGIDKQVKHNCNDTILNQAISIKKKWYVLCICAIGQKKSLY